MTTRLASWRTSGGFVMPAGLCTEEARPGISSESLQNGKCLRFVRTADSHFANHLALTWSCLYRLMIPVFALAGYRAIAPDLPGFGKSGKPAARSDYTYERHVVWMLSFVKTLDLNAITLACRDWGGLIGLRLAAEVPARLARIAPANTFLPASDVDLQQAFEAWLAYSNTVSKLKIDNIVAEGCATRLAGKMIAA